MKVKLHLLRFLLFLCTILLLMACGIPNVLKNLTQKTVSVQGGQTASGEISSHVLPDPSAGLVDLTSYHTLFTQDITGTLDGKPYERHSRLSLIRLNDPAQYDFTNAVNGSDIQDFSLRILAQKNAYYRWMQSNPECQGSTTAPNDGEVIEPASLLLPVDSASRVGVERVNQISSVHYRFDQNSLPITKDSGPVTGEVWIAEQGGYVVKYVLSSPLQGILTGKDLEVAQEWTYELDQVNTLQSIDLPDGCTPVPTGLPTPADARDVEQISGRMSYNSASSGRQVLDLYYQDLPGLGWVPHSPSPTGDITLPFLAYFDQEIGRASCRERV
jgi:hypothetical protein